MKVLLIVVTYRRNICNNCKYTRTGIYCKYKIIVFIKIYIVIISYKFFCIVNIRIIML